MKGKKKKDIVALKTLSYSEDQDRYILNIENIDRADIPDAAVHETGVKNSYVLDQIDYGEIDTTFNAIDLNLYMVNNSINDALSNIWTGHSVKVDWKQLIAYGIVGIVAIAVLIAVL